MTAELLETTDPRIVSESDLLAIDSDPFVLPEGDGWEQSTAYWLGSQMLGSVRTQTRTVNGRDAEEVTTLVRGRQVRGRQMGWLLRQNGMQIAA